MQLQRLLLLITQKRLHKITSSPSKLEIQIVQAMAGGVYNFAENDENIKLNYF